MRTLFSCPRCAWGFRREYVPAAALKDARAEVAHYRAQPTNQDWVDLVGLYRVITRARTGIRFASLEWAS